MPVRRQAEGVSRAASPMAQSAPARPPRAPRHGGQGGRRRVEIVIPVRHIWWAGILARHYARRGLEPIWIIDRGSHWLFRLWAALWLRRRVSVRPTAPRAETMLGPVVAGLDCDWVVRLDGDEIPSDGFAALLARLEAGAAPEFETAGCLAAARRWLRAEGGRIERSENRLFGRGGEDHQYRIFARAGLEITEAIHTPGFVVPTDRLVFLPPEICIWHVNWICYSAEERRAKIAGYDAQSAGAGSGFRDFYLPEDAAPGTHRWLPCGEAGPAKTAARIARFRAGWLCRLLLRIGPN